MTLAVAAAAQAAPRSSAPPHPPAEEIRLNSFQFRQWLRKQGFTEVLDLHLKDFPPSDPTAAALAQREFKLGEFRDARKSTTERQAAIGEANEILDKLILDFPEDPRALQWRYLLGYSLIYDQGEPSATAILYFGGSDDDRKTLANCARRSLVTTRALIERIARENARVDRLTAEEFEEVERRGLIEQLDRLGPSADYLLLWVLFYDSLARGEKDPQRVAPLREINETFVRKPELHQTPHEKSGIQAPALLLAGMTARGLGHVDLAADLLERAATVWEKIPTGPSKDQLRWVRSLALLEKARAERDATRFDRALLLVDRIKQSTLESGDDAFSLRLAATLVERSVHVAQIRLATEEGDVAAAEKFRRNAWECLAKLVESAPDRRDTVYATVLGQIGLDAEPAKLDPFEQSALLLGLCWEAQRDAASATTRFRQALQVGEALLRDAGVSKRLAAETHYQLGLVHLRLNDRLSAATHFIDSARRDPTSASALSAATMAASTAAEGCGEESTARREDACKTYADALDLLVGEFGDSDAGKYWRFFHAQLLDERGLFDAAADSYARVDGTHEYFLDAMFLRVRALTKALRAKASQEGADSAALAARADAILAALSALQSPSATGQVMEPGRLAEAKLLVAETFLLPSVDRNGPAVELVADASHMDCLRVRRAQVLAFDQLGDAPAVLEATRSLAPCNAAGAGGVLLELHAILLDRHDRASAKGDSSGATRRAEALLAIATALADWAKGANPASIGEDAASVQVRLAEAQLRAGHPDLAKRIFDELALLPDSTQGSESALHGRAEAHFQLGEYAEALPTFAKLATSLSPDSPRRWKALLRDLQCRTRLNQPAEGILKVIAQQKFLYPQMGGPESADAFEALRLENEKRRETQAP